MTSLILNNWTLTTLAVEWNVNHKMNHYENMSMQYTGIFKVVKNDYFQ